MCSFLSTFGLSEDGGHLMNCCFKKESLLGLIQKIDLLFLAVTLTVSISWNFPIPLSPRTWTDPKKHFIKKSQKALVTVALPLRCGQSPWASWRLCQLRQRGS